MKIAVVGSGISGLGAALLLQQEHEVHLFESDSRLGGHAHTTQITQSGQTFGVDTGFLVYNDLTYPHLKGLFKYLNVETVDSDMSLSLQIPDRNLEWAGDNLNTVFAQRRNLMSLRFYKFIFQILKFHKNAEKNRDLSAKNKWTIGELLKNEKYTEDLLEWYILPMVAAIWSTPEQGMLDFPAETFLTFFINHKLLQVNNRPVWKTVKNGSVQYVDKIAKQLKHIHLSEPVLQVESVSQGIYLKSSVTDYHFDKVVFATHAPITSKIFKFKNEYQKSLIDSFSDIPNKAVLHEDSSLMPQNKKCWSSWNVKAQLKTKASDKVSLTYFLNRLQPLPTKNKLLLTLNPELDVKNKILSYDYAHPKFDQKAIDAQKKIESIQGVDHAYFAGAWTRYGFHEDGLLSAVEVAKCFNIKPLWKHDI